MTYKEFEGRIRRLVSDVFSIDQKQIIFYPKGYRSDDSAEQEMIRQVNMESLASNDASLAEDILVVRLSEHASGIKAMCVIPIKRLYEAAQTVGYSQVAEEALGMLKDKDSRRLLRQMEKKKRLKDYESVKDDLIVRPLNYALHFKELEGCIYRRICGEIALVLYQILDYTDDSLCSCKVRDDDIEKMEMKEKAREVLQAALENTARLFPVCVYDFSADRVVGLDKEQLSKEDLLATNGCFLLSTEAGMNGAAALFYPGVIEKIGEIMEGSFVCVFMNVDDVMIFEPGASAISRYMRLAENGAGHQEMLSGRAFICEEGNIRPYGQREEQ